MKTWNSIRRAVLVAGTLLVMGIPVRAQVEQIKITGYLGQRMDECIEHRVKGQDVDHLVEPFRHQNEDHRWQSEFWGKWIQGAIASYRYNKDAELYEIIRQGAEGLMATQLPNGYIGNYAEEHQLKQWDVWGRKYTTLGLLAWYDLSGDKKALKAASRVIDHLMTQVGPDLRNITSTGNYHGMASSSILEPVIYLYQRTGEPRYLDFAKYIAEEMNAADGPQLIDKALAGVPVSTRFPHPKVWFSVENGQKAYEMMSCFEGLIEYYEITGSTPKETRKALVQEFNQGNVPVFLISLKAGGVGLNLTGADMVIHFDPWWNVAAQNQATDRTHRIGQTKKVTVYKLIAKNTIEEKILQLQEKKKELADQILEGESVSIGTMSKEELLDILG